ncbi:threonine dehydratase family protein [Tritrichomonas foetus]|uniref:Threonine dehydratase family protein n=1 Tax=Tritrichomonas foetus TaxID=1144522 RepID=A0A1J4JRT7_9EUKA|nr:threonine dehydratase family protein [Tritrichomonas foetus]|eukprot:OHT01466.1 threonine dehydratase family protein [Tritrichomonas foetus]
MTDLEVTVEDIHQAAENIKNEALLTPLRKFRTLGQTAGCDQLFLKLECYQRCKSFKFRGALNKIKKIPEGSTVICCSAGNHSQGVALASTICNCKSVIYMPENATVAKVQATQHYGGNVIQKGPSFDDAKAEMTKELEKNPEYIFVPPFDDKDIIAGQGTIGLEILDQLPDVDTVVIPIGGGGLISGVAVAVKSAKKNVRIIGVQMASCPGCFKKFNEYKKHEKRVFAREAPTPLADGIAVKVPGVINFNIIRQLVDDIVIVTEDEVALAVALLAERGKLIVEGSGAAPVAAVLNKKFKFTNNEKICCIISGGNIPLQMLARCIERALFLRKTRVELDVIIPYGTRHMTQMLKVFVDNNVQVISCTTVSHVDTVANKDHYSVVVDFLDPSILKTIQRKFDDFGWSYSIQSTRPVDE